MTERVIWQCGISKKGCGIRVRVWHSLELCLCGVYVGPIQLRAVGARTLITVSSTMLCTLVFPEGGVLSESSDDPDGTPCCDLGEGTVVWREGGKGRG